MPPGRDLDALARRFRSFARVHFRGRSPLYERLALGIADDAEILALAARCRPGQLEPLLLLAAVHHSLAAEGTHPLAQWFPSLGGRRDPRVEDPLPALRALCRERRGSLEALVAARRVQTNEPTRCTALLPAVIAAGRWARRPLALVELGASAGLNLCLDRYAYLYGDVARAGPPGSPVRLRCRLVGGRVPPTVPMPSVAWRLGLDASPVDVRDAEGAAWLRALVWPEHADRARVLAAALAAAAADPPPILRADVLDGLAGAADAAPRGTALCLLHSAVLPYLTDSERTRLAELVVRLGRWRDVAWISLEGPGLLAFPRGCEVDASLDPETRDSFLIHLVTVRRGRPAVRFLGRAGPHGQWLEWLGS
jgi:hypothetical protein